MATTIVAVTCSGTDTPEWRCQEVSPNRSVKLAFVEVRSQIVSLEVREDIPHDKAAEVRPLECRESAAIVEGREGWSGRRKQPVERVPLSGIKRCLNVSDSPVTVDRQVGDVTFERIPNL